MTETLPETDQYGVLTENELAKGALFSIRNKIFPFQRIMWEGAWRQHQVDKAHEAEAVKRVQAEVREMVENKGVESTIYMTLKAILEKLDGMMKP